VAAIVDPGRSGHFLDAPWPTDEHLGADGHPDTSGFPLPERQLTADVIGGWARRLETTAVGFGNNTGAFFRFDGALDLPATLPGSPDDPVVWIDAETGELAPLDLRFVADPAGDPFYAPHTLAVIPTLGHAPDSGATVVVAVLRDAGARPADGWRPDPTVEAALDRAGVSGRVAVATTFTVQDVTGQLRALRDDVDMRLDAPGPAGLRRVVRITVAEGTTEGGEDASLYTAHFEDGGSRTAYLASAPEQPGFEVDLLDPDYPAVVYEGVLETLNYQGLEDRPYMRPLLQHVQDTDRDSGWIAFDRDGLVSTPEPEPMRIVVALPRADDGGPADATGVLLYDHGTGGHAYNMVQRRDPEHDGPALLEAWTEAGFAVVGRDAPLYGTRYPLIDDGHAGGSLGFYNVVNLPAFRDNQRQAAVDGQVLLRWVQGGGLGRELPVSVDAGRIRRQGHSLGSVTANLGLAMDPAAYEAGLLTGTGGVFTHYFLDTGLLDNSIDADTLALVYGLFGEPVPEEVDPASVLGAALALPEPARAHIDRQHPALHLFQWTMDPSDPMAVARDETVPITVVISPGDWQTPDFTAEALAGRLPTATVRTCEARGAYDPHHCQWREPEGPEILRDWLGD